MPSVVDLIAMLVNSSQMCPDLNSTSSQSYKKFIWQPWKHALVLDDFCFFQAVGKAPRRSGYRSVRPVDEAVVSLSPPCHSRNFEDCFFQAVDEVDAA